MEKKQVKFVNYKKYYELVDNYKKNHNGEYPETLIIDNYIYKLAGGDDWRKVDIDEYHFRESCDTNNAFIYNTSSNEFAIVRPYLYDQLVEYTTYNHWNRIAEQSITEQSLFSNAKQIIIDEFNKAEYKGTFESFNIKNNKATKMIVNLF